MREGTGILLTNPNSGLQVPGRPVFSDRAAEEALAPRLNWMSIVRLLDKQKSVLLGTWLLGTLVAAMLIARLPSVYKAETLIMVESQKIPEKLVTATVNAELQDRVASLSQQILSVGRLEQLVDRFGLYRDERDKVTGQELIDEMRKDISIKVEKGWAKNQPGAIRVSYAARQPEVAAAVANQIGSFFVEENSKARESQAKGTSVFLEERMQEARKRLEEQEARLSEYKMRNSGELPEQKDAILSTLQRLQVELQGAQDAINRTQQQRLILENALASATASQSELAKIAEDITVPQAAVAAPPAASSSSGVPVAATTPSGRKRSDVLEEELDALLRRYTDSHPDVVALKEELQRVKRAEERDSAMAAEAARLERQRMARGEKPQRRPPPELLQLMLREKERVAGLKAQLDAQSREMQQREEDRASVLGLIATYQQRLESIPLREQEMAGLTRDYQITKSNYESLLDKNLAAEMASDMERRQKAERFVIIDKARLPERPERPKRMLLTLVSSLVALAAGLGLALMRELNRNVVLGEWEMPQQVPVLGRIPPIRLDPVESAELEV